MIDRIRIRNFKSLRDVDLKLGRVNLFVGLNASGKSNVVDALKVLQGLAHGFTLSETLSGKPRSDTAESWPGVRGGWEFAAFRDHGGVPAPAEDVRLAASLDAGAGRRDYEVAFDPLIGRFTSESISLAGEELVRATRAFRYGGGLDSRGLSVRATDGTWHDLWVEGERSCLARSPRVAARSVAPAAADVADELSRTLRDVQAFDPDIRVLRSYCSAGPSKRLGPDGQEFAAVVKAILDDESTREAYVSWLRELSASEVRSVRAVPGAANDLMFAVEERDWVFPAPVVSDGTLRFAALVAAFFQPDMPKSIVLEEIETGLHANRIRVLYLLLREQSVRANTQVFATTHSPVVLTWLRTDEEFDHTFLCRRDEASGETHVLPLSCLSGFVDLARQGRAGDLLVEGWMEMHP